MIEFLKFFNDKVHDYPMHLEIGYNKICDWTIHIYKKGCRENDKDLSVVDAQSCDMELLFAIAQIQFKEWLLQNMGGY